MTPRTLCMAASMIALLPLTLSAAPLLLDDFSDTQSVSANSGAPFDSNTISGSMLGGERTMAALWLGGPGSVVADANSGGSGLFTFSTGADTLGSIIANIGWEGIESIFGSGLVDRADVALIIPYNEQPVDITITAYEDVGGSLDDLAEMQANIAGGIFAPTILTLSLDFPTGVVDRGDIAML